MLLPSLGVVSNESTPPLYIFCCIVHGFLPSGLELLGVLLHFFNFLWSSSFALVLFFVELNLLILCCVVDGMEPAGGLFHVLQLPLVMFLPLGADLSDSNPPSPFLLCCVVDGLLLTSLELIGVSLGATFSESNPPFFPFMLCC